MTKARWMCRFWYIITFFSWECIVIKQSNNAGKTWVVAIWVMKLQMTQVSHDTHNRSTKRFACILLHAILDYTGLHWVLYHKCWVYVNWTVDAIVTALGRLGLWETPHLENACEDAGPPIDPSLQSAITMASAIQFSGVWMSLMPFPSKLFRLFKSEKAQLSITWIKFLLILKKLCDCCLAPFGESLSAYSDMVENTGNGHYSKPFSSVLFCFTRL